MLTMKLSYNFQNNLVLIILLSGQFDDARSSLISSPLEDFDLLHVHNNEWRWILMLKLYCFKETEDNLQVCFNI